MDLHGREGPGPLVEQPLEGGLVEHRRKGPARGAVPDPAEAQQGHPGGVSPFVDVGWLDDLAQLRPYAAGLQDAPDLVVEVHRPGERPSWPRRTARAAPTGP